MQINLNQLSSQLNKALTTVYLLSGDEDLLVQEARDQIKTKARQLGFEQTELHSTTAGFKWSELISMADSGQLFAEKKIIDIRNGNGKFDLATQKILNQYAANPNPDTLIIISTTKLTPSQKNSQWLKKLSQAGLIVSIWPISAAELPQWIQQRMQQNKLQADRESIEMLANYSEGNLLATHQAIEKLKLLQSDAPITLETMQQVLHECAQFNVFDLANYALAGNVSKVTRAIRYLHNSAAEPTLILWALARDIRTLIELSTKKDQGASLQSLLSKQWQSRQTLLKQGLSRLNSSRLHTLLEFAQYCDLCVKGVYKQNIWTLLSDLALGLCDKTLTPLSYYEYH